MGVVPTVKKMARRRGKSPDPDHLPSEFTTLSIRRTAVYAPTITVLQAG